MNEKTKIKIVEEGEGDYLLISNNGDFIGFNYYKTYKEMIDNINDVIENSGEPFNEMIGVYKVIALPKFNTEEAVS